MKLHARADDLGAEHRQHEEQSIEPPAPARGRNDPDTWLGLRFPFEGGRKRRCGFGHRNLRSEVSGQIAEVKKAIAVVTSAICPLQSRAASQSTAVPCRA